MNRLGDSQTCVVCNTSYALTQQTYKSRAGSQDLPFCLPCWRRLHLARRVLTIAVVFDALVLVGSMVLVAQNGGLAPIAFGIVVGAIPVVLAVALLNRSMPKAERVSPGA